MGGTHLLYEVKGKKSVSISHKKADLATMWKVVKLE